jgi:hypothetical protein
MRFAPNSRSGIFIVVGRAALLRCRRKFNNLWQTQFWSAPNGATKAKAKSLTC